MSCKQKNQFQIQQKYTFGDKSIIMIQRLYIFSNFDILECGHLLIVGDRLLGQNSQKFSGMKKLLINYFKVMMYMDDDILNKMLQYNKLIEH